MPKPKLKHTAMDATEKSVASFFLEFQSSLAAGEASRRDGSRDPPGLQRGDRFKRIQSMVDHAGTPQWLPPKGKVSASLTG
jgi:hypothetical protein